MPYDGVVKTAIASSNSHTGYETNIISRSQVAFLGGFLGHVLAFDRRRSGYIGDHEPSGTHVTLPLSITLIPVMVSLLSPNQTLLISSGIIRSFSDEKDTACDGNLIVLVL